MFFKRRKNVVSDELSHNAEKDTDSVEIERFKELLRIASPEKPDFEKEKQEHTKRLNFISKQIEAAKKDYDNAIHELCQQNGN